MCCLPAASTTVQCVVAKMSPGASDSLECLGVKLFFDFLLRVSDGRMQMRIIKDGHSLIADFFRIGLMAGGDEDFNQLTGLSGETIFSIFFHHGRGVRRRP